MFQGLRTVIYMVDDMDRAKSWYSNVLGAAPYFDEPFYVGYNVGGYELGLHPREVAVGAETAKTVVTYWGVADIEAAFARLVELGATPHAAMMDVGDGIKVADVIDPFGNIVGIITNPHFKLP